MVGQSKKYGNIFEQWSLRASPFGVEALRCDERGERLLKGRDDDIEDVMHKLHREGRITCIDGQFGVGKTSLVNVAVFRCMRAFKRGETNQLLLPVAETFQISEDVDVDNFVKGVLVAVVASIRQHEKLLQPICDTTGFSDFHRLLSQPVLKLESGDVSNSATLGVLGVATWTSGGKGSTTESPNNTDAFVNAGFESEVKKLLGHLFTSVGGGVVCIIDNIELLETANKARKTLELLRDRLLTVRGLRWVFCGANGVIHSLASSPRLSAFLYTPVIELKNVRTGDLREVVRSRVEEYSIKPETTLQALPFGFQQIEWLYEVLNFNLRDLLSHLEQYCDHVNRNRIQVHSSVKDALFRRWVQQFGEFHYKDVSARISKNAWLVLDAAMSDEFRGTFNASHFVEFNRNSKVPMTEDTYRRWLRDLKRYDILSQSIPEDVGEERTERELETYNVTSKGALVFYYRHCVQQSLTISEHQHWMRRIAR